MTKLHGPSQMLGPLTVEEVPTHRRLDCANYDQCLTVAVKNRWQGFTCLGCSRYCATERDEHRERIASSLAHDL